MKQRHLTDERLIELSVETPEAAPRDTHLSGCTRCQYRYATLSQVLEDVSRVADAEVDAAFSPERLLRQQARILQRIEQEGRPGRLIAFPTSQPQEPLLVRSRPTSRWLAAAAVAGVVVGLLTGQLLPTGQGAVATRIVSNEAGAGAPLRAVSTTLSEDELLGQVENAADGGPAALQPLDALTPRAWEVAQ